MRRYLGTLSAVSLMALVVTTSAFASAAYDLSSVSTGFTSQVLNAVTTALPIAGPIIALFVGWKVLKRMVRA
jgi:hypothetical protein